MKKKKNKKVNRTLMVRVNTALISALVLSFLAHLVIANHAAIQRSEISKFTQEYKQLELTQQQLALEAIELQSSERLVNARERLSLVKADAIHYISPKGAVALNN